MAQRHTAGVNFARALARGLLLTVLVYASWRYGAVDAITQWHISLLLIAAAVLTVATQPGEKRTGVSIRGPLLGVVALSLLWPWFQTWQLPLPVYRALATGQHEIDAALVQQPLSAIANAVSDKTAEGEAPRPRIAASEPLPQPRQRSADSTPRRSISVVRSLTWSRLSLWAMTGTVFVLASMLFDSRRSLAVLLWTLAVNTGLIAGWGLLQTATGTTDLLPGVSRDSVIRPFGPFVYKNAGAAILIPGLASSVALLWLRWSPPSGKTDSGRMGSQPEGARPATRPHPSSGGGRSPLTLDQPTTVLLMLTGTCTAGLLVSYSRGAWLAATVAAVALLPVLRQSLTKRALQLTVLPVLGIGFLLVAGSVGIDPIANRIESQFSTAYVYADARWNHWQDGLRTASKYFPVGSGLGTYGYATLAEQVRDSQLWFREAHNHYLETLTEQGLLGVVLLIWGGLLIGRSGYQLLTNRISRTWSAIGLTGLAALIASAVQSLVDFVIIIPAVALTLATLAGVVTGVDFRQQAAERASNSAADPSLSPRRFAGQLWPWACCAVPLLFLLAGSVQLREQVKIERVLRATAMPNGVIPNQLSITASLDRLDQAIGHSPQQSELYQRRADWHTLRFRHLVQQASASSGGGMIWEATDPSILFQTVMLTPAELRTRVVTEIQSDPELRSSLAAILMDRCHAIELNPFVPLNHLALVSLAPLGGIDPGVNADALCRLSKCNRRLQLMCGIVAHCRGDQSQQLDYFRRSLGGTNPELEQMVRLCRRTMEPLELVRDLIPGHRSALLLPLIRALHPADLKAAADDGRLLRGIEQKVYNDPSRSPAEQQGLLAVIAMELGQTSRAEEYWRAALAADPDNRDSRYEYCRVLLARQKYQQVFRHCSLGQSLEPHRDRFSRLKESALQQMNASGR